MSNVVFVPKILRIRITLLGIDPPIWRLLQVPSELTLGELHRVLQTTMGWRDSHLHEFRVGSRRFGAPGADNGHENEDAVRLCEILLERGATAKYIYDFGDNWEHSVVVEDVSPSDGSTVIPSCLEGEWCSPPEDCGGAPGYLHLLRVLDNRYDRKYREMRRWVGRDFDPEVFSVDTVNRDLTLLHRRNYQ